MALALYLATTLAILYGWSRLIQPISRGAALVLILLPMLFTGRALLTNRVYAPIDLPYQFEPLASQQTIEPHNIALSDLASQMIPWQKAVRHAFAQGEWPLWNPFILCGDILAAAAQPAVYEPVNLLGLILPLPHALTFGAAMTFFLAALFTFAFARALGCSETAALVGAAAYTFCAMIAFYVGWPLGRAWALFPLVLFGTRRLVRERKTGTLLCGLVLVIFAGHPESVLHVVACGAAYGLFEVLRMRAWKAIPLAILVGIAALLLTAIYLLPFAEAAPQTVEHSVRTKLYAPLPYEHLVRPEARTLRIRQTFVPFVQGDPLNVRVGYVVLALALLAVRRRSGEAWFFLALAVAGFLITCGIPPLPHLLHKLPLFDIAINERLAFAASFALAILAALGAQTFKPILVPLLLAVVLIERVIEDGSIYPSLPARMFYPPVPALEKIRGDGRVAGIGATLIPNASAMYGLEDVRGYEAMTFARLAETYPLWSRFQTAFYNSVDDPARPFLSMLNVRWFLDGTRVAENPHTLPRAFVPRSVRYEREGTAVLEQMKETTDFAERAWIETSLYEPHDTANGSGRVSIRRDGLAYELDATMERAGWIVVSESAWKGWRAYIDGRRVETRFANHAFLGIHVAAGRHRLRLVYLPESFTRGRTISLIALALVVLCYSSRACRRLFSTSPPPPRSSSSGTASSSA